MAVLYNNRGVSKFKLEDYEGAIADYYKALEINPNFADAYYNRGVSKLKLKNQKESACLDLNKATELGSKDAKEKIETNCK